MKFPPITTTRLEYVPSFRSYPPLILSFPFSLLLPFSPFPLHRTEVFHRLPHAHRWTCTGGPGKMSRNVFESIPFASYFAPHRRKVGGSSSTSVQEMDSGQKFSNVTTVTKILCTPATSRYYVTRWKFGTITFFFFKILLTWRNVFQIKIVHN